MSSLSSTSAETCVEASAEAEAEAEKSTADGEPMETIVGALLALATQRRYHRKAAKATAARATAPPAAAPAIKPTEEPESSCMGG